MFAMSITPHAERYGRLVVRNPDGSTEGRDPRTLSLDDLGDFLTPIRALRAKCIDCSGGSAAEAVAYQMGTSPRHAGAKNPRAISGFLKERGEDGLEYVETASAAEGHQERQ
jgi:hypothetical protein